MQFLFPLVRKSCRMLDTLALVVDIPLDWVDYMGRFPYLIGSLVPFRLGLFLTGSFRGKG